MCPARCEMKLAFMGCKALLELNLGLGRSVAFIQCKQAIEVSKAERLMGKLDTCLNWQPRRPFRVRVKYATAAGCGKGGLDVYTLSGRSALKNHLRSSLRQIT